MRSACHRPRGRLVVTSTVSAALAICSLFRRSAHALGVTALLATSLPSVSSGTTNDANAQTYGIVQCSDDQLRKHNPGIAIASDRLVCFEAYISDFSTRARELGPDDSRFLGIPHWTVQQVDGRNSQKSAPEGQGRPRTWFTMPDLQKLGGGS